MIMSDAASARVVHLAEMSRRQAGLGTCSSTLLKNGWRSTCACAHLVQEGPGRLRRRRPAERHLRGQQARVVQQGRCQLGVDREPTCRCRAECRATLQAGTRAGGRLRRESMLRLVSFELLLCNSSYGDVLIFDQQ